MDGCESKGKTDRIGINDLDFLLPPVRSVSGYPEHPPEHALQPILNVAGLHPSGLRKRSLLVQIGDENGL